MGTPEFAIPTLEKLVERYRVVGVVTQPDRPAGRGRRLVASPVKEFAVAEGIPVLQPTRVRSEEAVEQLRAWRPEIIVVAAYGQILPPSVLAIPPLGVLNVHASLLPRWRGASPIQGALLAGDEVTGATIMKLDEGMDTGPLLASRETPIAADETAGELEERLAQLGAELLMEVLPMYLDGQLEPHPQPEAGVTLTRPLRTSDARLDWTATAACVHNRVRAFSPVPGAYTTLDDVRLKVLQSQVLDKDDRPTLPADAIPGTTFLYGDLPAVVTGEGALALLYVQMAGKRPMDGGAFVRGRKDFVGAVLGSPQPGA